LRIEFFSVDVSRNLGPRYILRPENKVEQRFLTILRDAMLGEPNRLRFIGSENMEGDIQGMPHRPVLAASLCIETLDGKVPPEFASPSLDKLDATKATLPSDGASIAVSSGKKGIRVIRQTRTPGGPTTVVEEDIG